MNGRSAARILIVDPDDHVAEEYSEFFARQHWLVTRARTCREALDLAARISFHYAILDLMLPDEVGTHAWQQLRRRQPGLRGVLTTSSPSLHANIRSDDRRLLGFLLKPLTRERLLHVASLIGEYEAGRELPWGESAD